jgi:Transposase, Mutator family
MDISRWLCASSSRRAWTCCRVMVQEFAEALIGAEADALCGRPTGSASPERGSPPWSSSLDDRRLLRCRCLHPALIVAVQETLTGAARQRGRIHFMCNPLNRVPKSRQSVVATMVHTSFLPARRRHGASSIPGSSPSSKTATRGGRIARRGEPGDPSASRASRRSTPPMLVEWTGGTFLY